MKPNKLTAGENVRWETKMMLPEYKEAWRMQQKEKLRRQRPELDDQQKETIGRALMQSYQLRQPVSLRMFDEFEDLEVTGVVEYVSGRRFRVDGEWFEVEYITNAEIDDSSLY